jgi:tetratricopeptide (TPR) repeat protein
MIYLTARSCFIMVGIGFLARCSVVIVLCLFAFAEIHAQTQVSKRLSSRGMNEFLVRGLAKTDSGDFAGAIQDFTFAVKNSLANAEAYRHRGYARLNIKDYEGVISDCSEVLRVNSQDSNAALAYLYRAYAKFFLKQYQGTTHDCSSALALDPYDEDALSLRGMAKAELNDYEGAMNDYTDALRLNHGNAMYFFLRGQVKARQRDYIGACADFTMTIQLEPQAAQALLHRGRAKIALNEPSACEDFQSALRLGFAEAREAVTQFCR